MSDEFQTKAAVSVAEMARMVGLSRSRFYQLIGTAFPQPEPGKAESPGPVKNLPAGKLRSLLGVTSVAYVERNHSLATTDISLQ